MRHNSNCLAIHHHRHTGNILGLGQFQYFADGLVRRNRNRVLDHAAFIFLDAAYFPRLGGDGHVLVDDAHSAFLGNGDRQTCLGHCIHRCREHRQIETDATSKLRAEVYLARQYFGISGYQEHIVKS